MNVRLPWLGPLTIAYVIDAPPVSVAERSIVAFVFSLSEAEASLANGPATDSCCVCVEPLGAWAVSTGAPPYLSSYSKLTVLAPAGTVSADIGNGWPLAFK